MHRGGEEVGDPRRHQVEHVTLDHELVVERADGRDGAVVDVGDEAVGPVERGVVVGVGPIEEPAREPVLVDHRATVLPVGRAIPDDPSHRLGRK